MPTAKTKTVSKSTITIQDIGPNRHITIPLDPDGGIVILRGRNDTGKTEALRAIAAATGQAERLTVRRDAPLGSAGHLEAPGVSLKVTNATRRHGEAEFSVLPGRLSVADIVDPHIKDPAAADNRRIRALISLAHGIGPIDRAPWAKLVGGDGVLTDLLGPVAIDVAHTDLATTIKKRLEARAREAEKERDISAERARTLLPPAGNYDCGESHKSDADLQQDLMDTGRAAARIDQQAVDAQVAQKAAGVAQEKLEELAAAHEGPTQQDALQAHHEAQDAEAIALTLYRQAESAFAIACNTTREKAAALKLAESHAHDIAVAREIIAKSTQVTMPTAEQRQEAADAYKQVTEAIAAAGEYRRHERDVRKATEASGQAARATIEAANLRQQARGTDDVLSDLVGTLNVPLKVRGGRLVVAADKDGERNGDGSQEKYYGELSTGARWRRGIKIAIKAVGPHGLIPIPQDAWESLDYVARADIAQEVKGSTVTVVTAEASRSPADDHGDVVATPYAK